MTEQNTEKSAEIIGKTFYQTLRKNGFSEKQIIYVAINMIGCLTESLRGEENLKKQQCPGPKGLDVIF